MEKRVEAEVAHPRVRGVEQKVGAEKRVDKNRPLMISQRYGLVTRAGSYRGGESDHPHHLVLYHASHVLHHKGRALYRENALAVSHGLDDSGGRPVGGKVDYLACNGHLHTGHAPALLASSGHSTCRHHSRDAVARMRGGEKATCVFLVVG